MDRPPCVEALHLAANVNDRFPTRQGAQIRKPSWCPAIDGSARAGADVEALQQSTNRLLDRLRGAHSHRRRPARRLRPGTDARTLTVGPPDSVNAPTTDGRRPATGLRPGQDLGLRADCGRPPRTARRCRSRWCAAGAPRRTGPIPFLLYGYGAYEISTDPGFSVSRLSLLDRGAGMAIAHVRGGGEMGRHWYDDGKLLHKQHTFSDFAACARHLVETGWTTPRPARGRGRLGRRAADRRGRQPVPRPVRRPGGRRAVRRRAHLDARREPAR